MPRRDELDDSRPWYAKPGFLVAAAFVMVVLLVGLVVTFGFTRGGGSDTEPSETSTNAAPEPPDVDQETGTASTGTAEGTAAPEADGETGCEAPEGSDPQAALTVPPDVEWLPTGEVPAALSERDGPEQREALLSCYAQTSTGALLAAYNFLAQYRTSSNDPVEVFEALADESGPRYEELMEYSRTGFDSPEAYGPFSPLGYRFYSYADDQAEVALVHAISDNTGTMTSLDVVTVRWTGDTWTVWTLTDIEPVSELPAGFVAWGPAVDREE
ncbi:hypothetical protein ACI3EY_16985 [Ornithinimicrobium sp. LYQ92]|uniref:hypothetical protein n=1 Tax=Serinicoccus sp. LYQ92 TaxID=3378798 RepID=UPI0038522F23